MFSERIPCTDKTHGCSNFLDDILPSTEGTAVGYFTAATGEMGTREVETLANHMVGVYQNYINSNYFDNDIDWSMIDDSGNTISLASGTDTISSTSSYSEYYSSSGTEGYSSWGIEDVPPNSSLVVIGVKGRHYPINKHRLHPDTSTSTDS